MIKFCQWCDNSFDANVSYQIYCSTECRDFATKEKITQRYVINKRSKKSAKPRKCKSCDTILSVYNDDPLCQKCNIIPKDVQKALKEIKGMANGKDK